MRFRRLALQMHNRQSAASRTGVATNAQLLIIVLLNTQFIQPGTDCSAGAIIMEENKARQRHVEKKREINTTNGETCTLTDKTGRKSGVKTTETNNGFLQKMLARPEVSIIM